MGKQEELQKLDRTVKDGEIRLRTVKTNIDLLDKEISTLSEVEAQLEENIRCLKKKNIVAMAGEFKKAKEDLAKTKTRLTSLQNDRERFKKSANEVEQVMKKAQEDIETMKKNENNILHGKFKRKDNG